MEEDTTTTYRIKDILFFGSPRRVLLQSANGPCPLLALCNILLLRNQIAISQDHRYISFDELVQLVSGYMFDSNQGGGQSPGGGGGSADLRENLQSCLEVLPKLNVGLDVNCQFRSPTAFEFTRELGVFDMLDIALFHGWVVSKQDELAFKALGDSSYNQVVERLIASQEAQASAAAPAEPAPGEPAGPDLAKVIEEGLIIQDWLDRSASQLTYDGLSALHESVRERQLAVFFRNSHFSAMLKYQGNLFLLCTDIAFAHSHVVWECLNEVDGDTSYCDANFRVNQSSSDEAANLAAAQAAQDSIFAHHGGPNMSEADKMLAMQLMQEDLHAEEQAALRARQQQAAAQRPAPAPAAAAQPAGGGAAGGRAAAGASGANQGLLAGQGRSNVGSDANKKKCCTVQ